MTGAEKPAEVHEAPPILLRAHRPGDMGWVIERHGALYAAEYGWDEHFEALVARIAADFIDHLEPEHERCWIAERDGQRLGCVFLVRDRDQPPDAPPTARLRLLLVDPAGRGLGLGRTLVREVTTYARNAGYHKILLWTNSVLDSARRIYDARRLPAYARKALHCLRKRSDLSGLAARSLVTAA